MKIERLHSGFSGRAKSIQRQGPAWLGNLRRMGRGMACTLLCLALVAGCQSYRDGKSRTVGELTDDSAIQSTSYRDGKSRTVGELTDDSAIQLKVKTQLMADRNVKGFRLNVEVKRRVVSLHGRVTSQEMRERALEIAGSIKGVASVEDRLEVVAP